MPVLSIEAEDKDSRRRRWYAKSACAAQKIHELLTDDEIQFETGIPATTFKNYRLGITALPIEAATIIYAKFPETRSILYSILCPEGFSIVQQDVTIQSFSSEMMSKNLMELTSSLGSIADRFVEIQNKFMPPRKAILEKLMDDVIKVKYKIDTLLGSTSNAISTALYRKGSKQ